MPFDPQGNHTLPAGSIVTTGDNIIPSQHNPPLQDISSSLSQVLMKDGRAPMVGPLNMNGNAILNLAPGTDPTSVATVSQAMPIGAVVDFAGATAPAGWLLCYGQAVSRTVYAALFAAIGTTYGAGNGSTTFNLPDCRGFVIAGRDDMGGAAANRLTTAGSGINGVALGASGGAQNIALSQAQLPAVSPTFTGTTDPVSVISTDFFNNGFASETTGGGSFSFIKPVQQIRVVSTGSFTPRGAISPLGSGAAHPNAQPTLIMNKIIRASYNG